MSRFCASAARPTLNVDAEDAATDTRPTARHASSPSPAGLAYTGQPGASALTWSAKRSAWRPRMMVGRRFTRTSAARAISRFCFAAMTSLSGLHFRPRLIFGPPPWARPFMSTAPARAAAAELGRAHIATPRPWQGTTAQSKRSV